jgi:hypothetical protein
MGIDYKKKYLKYKNKYLEAKKIYGGGVDDFSQEDLLRKIEELQEIIKQITKISKDEQLNEKLIHALDECKKCPDLKQKEVMIASLEAKLEAAKETIETLSQNMGDPVPLLQPGTVPASAAAKKSDPTVGSEVLSPGNPTALAPNLLPNSPTIAPTLDPNPPISPLGNGDNGGNDDNGGKAGSGDGGNVGSGAVDK